ncbi:cytochrome P450 4V2-like [Dermacentor variabilis]|uniref:cytochrome P450 4V2-like n=1 Tax=Dermacentor variabilis TaxID=34621 RepID=UPI003F5C82A3
MRLILPVSPGSSLGSLSLGAMFNTTASVRTYSLWIWMSCRAVAALLVACGAAKLILWCWYQYRLLRALEDIPGPGGRWPLLFTPRYFLHSLSTNPRRAGSTVEFFQWIRGLSEVHRPKGFFKIYAGLNPIVFLCTAETAEPLLSSTSNLKKSVIYDNMHPWLGSGGLLTSYGARWRQHRKLLTPAFHFRVLDNFLPIINDQGERLVQELSQLANETYVNLFPTLSRCALATICETAMGLKVHSPESTSAVSEYERDLETAIKLFMKRVLQPWTWIDAVYWATARGVMFGKVVKRLHCFTTKVIVERQKAEAARRSAARAEGEQDFLDTGGSRGKAPTVPPAPGTEGTATGTGAERPAFLDLLSHYYRKGIFSVEDMRQEVDTFMFAGHDTSAQTLTWTLFALAINPGVQRRVHDELDRVFGKRAACTITKSHVSKLTYLDRVLKETMRIFTIVPWVGRSLTEPLKIGNCTIPEGCTCYVFTYGIHRDPTHYTDPEVFDPDRFLPEKCSRNHPFAFVPFSAGPRNCIGQKFAMLELKVLLAKVLTNFSVSSCNHRDDLLFDADILLRTKRPIRIRLQPRHDTGFK